MIPDLPRVDRLKPVTIGSIPLGVTTQTFKAVLETGACKEADILKWAAGAGFSWVEVRDFDGSMSVGSLVALRDLSLDLGIRIHYAWDGADLYLDGEESYLRGLKRAAVFGEGTCSRITIAASYLASREKAGYPVEVFDILRKRIEHIIRAAAREGIVPVFENSYEPMVSEGYHSGFADFFSIPGFMMTLDAANFLNIAQARRSCSADEVLSFIRAYRDKIPYVHLKSTVAGVLCDILTGEADLAAREILDEALAARWACLELPTGGDWTSMTGRLLCSCTPTHSGSSFLPE